MMQLDRLFKPSSIAVVGASRDRRKSGGMFLASLVEHGYRGQVYPVNRREPDIMGFRAYPSVAGIPGAVDLAIIAVPAGAVNGVIADCAGKGVPFAIVHTAGFGELGPEGREAQEGLVQTARSGGVRIIGPNCMGIYSPRAGINTISTAPAAPDLAGGVAFVGQSGWATENVIEMGYERGLRFSKVVSIGNRSDLSHEDLLAYLAADKETSVVGFYAEGFRRGDEFLRLARAVSRRKPVIVWETGRTEGSSKVTFSHTGSAGDDLLPYDSLRAAGVITADGLEELVDLLVGFASPVMPGGNRVGLLSEAGGAAASGAQAALALGLEMPVLSAGAQEELSRILAEEMPPFPAPRNPVDTVWTPEVNSTEFYERCARAMLPEVDALVIVNFVGFDDSFAGALARVRDDFGKPVLFAPGHPSKYRDGARVLTRHGLPAFTVPDRALGALAAMLRFSRRQAEA